MIGNEAKHQSRAKWSCFQHLLLKNNIAKKTKHSCRRRRSVKVPIWRVIFESEKFGIKKRRFGNRIKKLQTRKGEILEGKEGRVGKIEIRDSWRKNGRKEVFWELGQKFKIQIRELRQRTANQEKIIRKRNFWSKSSIWGG